jgi:hypothetical protein
VYCLSPEEAYKHLYVPEPVKSATVSTVNGSPNLIFKVVGSHAALKSVANAVVPTLLMHVPVAEIAVPF